MTAGIDDDIPGDQEVYLIDTERTGRSTHYHTDEDCRHLTGQPTRTVRRSTIPNYDHCGHCAGDNIYRGGGGGTWQQLEQLGEARDAYTSDETPGEVRSQ